MRGLWLSVVSMLVAVSPAMMAAPNDPAVDALKRGLAYEHGKGAPQSYVEAARWYLTAAKLGNRDGQYGIALLVSTGQGVPQDFTRAYVWANIAVANGMKSALRLRERMGASLMGPPLIEAQAASTRCWNSKYQDCP